MQSIFTRPILLLASVTLLAIGTLPASDVDDRIAAAFAKSQVELALPGDAIEVSVADGVVTLTGMVADGYHRHLVDLTAAGLPGVVRVDDRLATWAEVAANDADVWIARKVLLALVLHAHADAGTTGVAVQGGVVTLSGPAASVADKNLATTSASEVDGVADVVNTMAVRTGRAAEESERIDDASIATRVRTVLSTRPSEDSVTTRVETLAGVVVLSGIARNADEKSRVTRLVSDIAGVKSVDNRMTLSEAPGR